MIKLFWIPLVLVVILYVGCKEQQSSNEQLPVAQDSVVQKMVQVTFQKLTADAVKELNKLPEFKPLKAALDSLNQITPEISDEFVPKLNERASNFEELLPKKFRTSPITARLKVLITETGMLNQKINQGVVNMETLNTSKKAIAKAYNNFVNQVNELYLEIPANIARELLEDSKVLSDSVTTP